MPVPPPTEAIAALTLAPISEPGKVVADVIPFYGVSLDGRRRRLGSSGVVGGEIEG
jgi:hypothetical protein